MWAVPAHDMSAQLVRGAARKGRVALALACLAALAATSTAAAPIIHPSFAAGWVNTANQHSPLGTNLAGVTYWTAQYPFVDFMKMSSPWISGNESTWDDGRPLSLDSDGNVRRLLAGQVARTVLFAGADPGLASKKLVLRWQGSGMLGFGNVQVLSQAANQALLQLRPITGPNSDLMININILRTNASNPIRNLRLLPPSGGICTGNPLAVAAGAGACPPGTYRSFAAHHSQIVFCPDFLNDIKQYRLLRFMDWLGTNNSPLRHWADRPLLSHQVWSTERGVPLEAILALSKVLGADPWLCIPHQATDAYVTAFATMVKEQLGAGRRAHLEYSNEVWNGIFDQTAWVQARADAAQLFPSNAATALVRYYSRRSQQVFRLAAAAMGGTARLRRCMCTQAVVPYFTQQILGFEAAQNLTDLFCIAPYFGATWSQAAQGALLKQLGADGIFRWLAGNGTLAERKVLGYGSLPSVDWAVQAQLAALAPFGTPLAAYEGGQHLLAAGPLHDDAALNALLDAVNRDPRMKGTYLQYLSSWRRRSRQVFNHFVHVDRWSAWGRWGAKEYPTQPPSKAPKYSALLDFIAANPI